LRDVLPRWAIPVTAGLFAAGSRYVPDVRLRHPADSIFSHRGFFHSPAFLIVLAMALAWARGAQSRHVPARRRLGRRGAERLFFPWHPIRVSPLGIARFFDAAALAIGLIVRWLLLRSHV